ncbi:MAG: LuxR family transcriptional regulator [Mycobacterium sp.]
MINHPESIVGRADELTAIRSLVTAARNGLSGALVVRGEPGIGKTALLDAATGHLAGVRVIRIDGYAAESSMPYAGLQRIGTALDPQMALLPPRLSDALRVAWGLDAGPPPDRYLVGLASLALCAAAGTQTPVVCVLDDAQWLDAESLSVLGFVARRLTAESTVFIFATRDNADVDLALAGISSLRLSGLVQRAAIQLLTTVLPSSIDPFSAVQIADATGGHPLALVDLARDLSLRQIDDLTLTGDPVPVSRRLETHYLRQVRELPEDVQSWLLIAAAASGGQRELIERSAAELGLSPDCRDTAAKAGLVALGDTVEFRHPLVRSSVYGATAGHERRQTHALLAEQAALLGLVELEVWHAAEAVVGPSEAVAERLQQVAEQAKRRGGLVSQASLLARAADLTEDRRRRNERLLAAAESAGSAGAAQLSRSLLDRVDSADLDRTQQGRLLMAQSAVAMFVADPAAVKLGAGRLLHAADHFREVDPVREHRALLQAFENSLVTEWQMQGLTLKDLGHRFDMGARNADAPYGLILQALAAHVLLPYAEAVPLMRAALTTLMSLDDTTLPEFGFVGIAFAMALFDAVAATAYLERQASIARNGGALRALDTVLWVRSSFEVGRGDPAAATTFIEQVRELRRAIGYEAENVVNVSQLVWAETPTETVEAIGDLTLAMGFAGVHTAAEAALAVREISEAHHDRAYERINALQARPFLHVTYLQLADLVEAAVRSGHLDKARSTAATVTAMAAANPTPWLRGLDHRCRALLAADDAAAEHYTTAIGFLEAAAAPMDLGRAHLLYGEWLRRKKRRRDAREHLRRACEIFGQIEAPSFTRRARTELEATGEQGADRQLLGGVAMTAREAAVAKMAAAGATNAEIAATLFITANTVDYHLRKVFQKLGVSSRRQLVERFNHTD